MKKINFCLILLSVLAVSSLFILSCDSDINSPPISNNEYEVIFDSTYDISSFTLCESFDVIEVSQGGFLVAGSITHFNSLAALIRIDENGKQIWNMIYSNAMRLYSVIETSDNCFVVIGKSTQGIYILKIDYQGNIIWEIIQEFAYEGFAAKVIENKAGDYLVIANSYTENSKARLICVNASGSIVWEKFMSGNGLVKLYSIFEKPDTKLELIGISNVGSTNEPWLLTLDKDGNFLDRIPIYINITELDDYFESTVHQNSIGYYAGCGSDIFILLDEVGGLIVKSKIPGPNPLDIIWAKNLSLYNDDGFIICGGHSTEEEEDSAVIIKTYTSLFFFNKDGRYLNTLDVQYDCKFSEANSVIMTKDKSIVIAGSAKSCLNDKTLFWVKKIQIK